MFPARSHNTPTTLTQFLFGSSYYPEHWDPATRAEDPARFQAANWNVIRMAEFAWDRIEPEPGHLDFSLFDETIAAFGALGIQTILCTPTAAPPRWLTLEHPEVLRIDTDGRPMLHGSRQHASHFSPVYREHSRRITHAMAEHYADNPHVIGWQTDNEFHCHFIEDHGPDAVASFTGYLERKYKTIDALNKAWGTAFWGQTYRRFEEIPTPRAGRPTHPNPAHMLDYQRFLSYGVTLFQREQVEILRATQPAWWITHNGLFHSIDYAGEFSADLDFLGYDSYPLFHDDPSERRFSQAFNMDHARAYSGNVIILEQQSGPGGQGDFFHDNPEPGEMRRMAWTNIARGADGLLFFRERSCPFGAEEFWCGILDHDNVPRRRYHEAAELGSELTTIGPELLGTHVEIDIGVAAADFDAKHGHAPITHGLPTPKKVAALIHRNFNEAGYAVGCVHPLDDLSDLHVLCVPHFSVCNPQWIPHWRAWVESGGILLVGARTGIKNSNGNVIEETFPGPLRDLAGVTVEEYGRQNRPDLRPLPIAFENDESTVSTEFWYEILEPDVGTDIVAVWSTRHLAGRPACTCRRIGSGAVLYLGTYFTNNLLEKLRPTLQEMGLPSPRANHQALVEQVTRANQEKRFRFLINHAEHDVRVELPTPGVDLISKHTTDGDGSIKLPANGVAVIREQV